MKKSGLLFVAVILCLLTGCPYISRHPAGKPAGTGVRSDFLGTWLDCETDKKAGCLRLNVYRFNDMEYYAETSRVRYDNAERLALETERYRAFSTDIGTITLINMQRLDVSSAAPAENFFVKAELTGSSRLKISYVSDNFVKTAFNSTEELAGYLKKNWSSPGLFEDAGVFEKEAKK